MRKSYIYSPVSCTRYTENILWRIFRIKGRKYVCCHLLCCLGSSERCALEREATIIIYSIGLSFTHMWKIHA
jgi:hypothetical protein